MSSFFYLSLSTSFATTRSAYSDYNLLNLHVAMCDNDQGRIRGWGARRNKYDFLAYNRDFSHEIPQKCSRLPRLGAIFSGAPPPPLNLKSWIRP